MNSAGFVLTPGGTSEMSIATSDFAVYRYGYISYDGSQWEKFELSGKAMGSDWLNGSVSAQLPLDASDFGLSQEKTSAARNFVVIYSCSRAADAWDCHDGWQILRFDASLADQSPSWTHGLYTSTAPFLVDWNTRNNNADTPGYLLNIDRDYHLNTQKPGYVPYQYPHPWRVPAEQMLSHIGNQP